MAARQPGLLCGAQLTGSCREGVGGWATLNRGPGEGGCRWGWAGGKATSPCSIPGRLVLGPHAGPGTRWSVPSSPRTGQVGSSTDGRLCQSQGPWQQFHDDELSTPLSWPSLTQTGVHSSGHKRKTQPWPIRGFMQEATLGCCSCSPPQRTPHHHTPGSRCLANPPTSASHLCPLSPWSHS